ncbi:Uncharacterized protein B5E38_5015 [Bacillus cereus]|nr:Uncharacterized protein B5E38_5015 [Bacillus cereus]ARO65101.1 Uncharacterized protein B5E39_2730 [Bacillus cereus]
MRIALIGEARTGKDTIGEYLVKKFFFSRLAFGDFMKEEYFKANPQMLHLPKNREHMIEWSQPQVMDDNHIWVRPLERRMNIQHLKGQVDFVITDMRQPHEYIWAKERDFIVIRVIADSKVTQERAAAIGEKLGKDLPMDFCEEDFRIYNNGNLADLYSQIDSLVYQLEPIVETP